MSIAATMPALYDSIGLGYRRFRGPDPRIQQTILNALDGAASVLNVGAGAGSYEPRDRFVVAVEPSMVMIRQRATDAGAAVRGAAEALPFPGASFDATTAFLTIHHWPDWRRGIRELARVARRRVVLLTWVPCPDGFWLVDDYFPEILEMDLRIFPSIDALAAELGAIRVETVEVPHDCVDGFLGAYWRRPEAYLDAAARRSISTFSKLRAPEAGLARLKNDLQSGAWHRKYGSLLIRESLDLGYRVVVAGPSSIHARRAQGRGR